LKKAWTYGWQYASEIASSSCCVWLGARLVAAGSGPVSVGLAGGTAS
jgi:hypothetical protein